MKINSKLFLQTSILLLFYSTNSHSAGYSTELYSTSGLGNAYAGSAAGIHDSSDMFFNPATISDIKQKEFIASVSYLDLRIDPDNANGKFSNGFQASGNEVSDAGSKSFVPAFYFATPINDKTSFGLSVNSPFGLSTEYDKNWVGRYRALESNVRTVNINPNISYKINDQISIGAGVQAQYFQTTLTKAVVNLNDPYNSSSDFLGKAKGSDWGYGYTLGTTYKINEKLKLGIGYRSKIDHKITGTTEVAGYGWYSDFDAKTTTPESLTVGSALKVTESVDLAYDVRWTRWSRLKSLKISAIQNQNLNQDNVTNFNWHDSFLHSVGANVAMNKNFILRAGAAYEKDAVTNANREPRAPNGNKIWTSLGFNYKINNGLSIDGTYMHQFVRNGRINLVDSSNTNNSLYANYKSRSDIFSLAVKKEF